MKKGRKFQRRQESKYKRNIRRKREKVFVKKKEKESPVRTSKVHRRKEKSRGRK